MRVAQYINSTDAGGAETLVVEISNYLSNHGIDNIIFHHGNEWIAQRVKVRCIEVPLWSAKSAIPHAVKFSKLLKEHKITHLHSHLFGATIRGMLAAKLAGIPHVATQHDSYTVEDVPSRLRWLKVAQMLGTKIVTVSRGMNKAYQGLNTTIVYNGVNTTKFRPIQVKRSLHFQMISVGRLELVKNYHMLLDAMDIVVNVKKRRNVHLTIVGDGELRPLLEQYVEDHLPDNVKFFGMRDDIPDLLSHADLFALSSKTEGLSCSILEAMACGLPILATNVGGNSELVDDMSINGNGRLVESGNAQEMADEIERMSLMFSLERLGKNSVRLVEEKFSFQTMVNRYLDLYGSRYQIGDLTLPNKCV